MKTKYFWRMLVGLFAMFAAVSCGSTPPAEQHPVQPDTGALDAAQARAQVARAQVVEFNGPELFPSEWENADSLFASAERERSIDTVEEIVASAERYNTAADALEALAAMSIARSFENMERALAEARAEVVAMGAEQFLPDVLSHADNTVTDARKKQADGDFLAARETAASALDMYGFLATTFEIKRIRAKIAEPLYEWEPDYLLQADDAIRDAFQRFDDDGDYSGARVAAVQALAMFTALDAMLDAYNAREQVSERLQEVNPQAFEQGDLAAADTFAKWEAGDFGGARTAAMTSMVMYLSAGAAVERTVALEARADVAARQEFNYAQSLFAQADQAHQAQHFGEAGRLFTQSAPLFSASAELARERQLIAEEALRLANERVAESEEIAREAEKILEGDL
ncbi:MAG: hypothetical protein FWD91_00095 [Treponema sp.]|nr:hypothetical protein [Treponema sp.]